MSFLAPAAFALALLIPVIIAMYLLKLRRTEQVVSSVYLWRRMVRDVEANAPWQKLRRNLLLIVQLLFLSALIVALARPFSWTEGVGGQAVILVLDTSASMSATDIAPSRLDAAKAQAQQLVDGLSDDVRVTVIAAGDGAQVRAASSRDRRQIRTAIGGIETHSGGSDLTAAMELASAIAARQPDIEVIVFSDGRVTLPDRQVIKGHVRYMPMGISGDNQAISVLSLQPIPGGGSLIAYVQVANYAESTAHRRLALYADGKLVSAHDLEIEPGGHEGVVVDDLPSDARVVEALLSGEDVLPLDDRAWAVYRAHEPVAVTLVTQGNLFLETALALFPGLEVTTVRPADLEEGAGAGDQGTSDVSTGLRAEASSGLTIFDGYVPITATMPAGNLLFVAPPRSTSYFSVTGKVDHPVPRAVSADDPLLANVSLAEVSVLDTVRTPLPAWARSVIVGDPGPAPGRGTVEGTTPLLFAGETDGRHVAVLAFDLRHSDLPLQVAFPLLLANLVGWLAPGSGGDIPTQIGPGETVAFSPPPGIESVRVTRPDGSAIRLSADGGRAVLADTVQLGVYRAEWGEGEQVHFAVDLFSPQESDVRPAEALPVAGTGDTGEDSVPQRARHEWWRTLGYVALALLSVEWMVYQRGTLARLWARARKWGDRWFPEGGRA